MIVFVIKRDLRRSSPVLRKVSASLFLFLSEICAWEVPNMYVEGKIFSGLFLYEMQNCAGISFYESRTCTVMFLLESHNCTGMFRFKIQNYTVMFL